MIRNCFLVWQIIEKRDIYQGLFGLGKNSYPLTKAVATSPSNFLRSVMVYPAIADIPIYFKTFLLAFLLTDVHFYDIGHINSKEKA
jgi:hypothetical protein